MRFGRRSPWSAVPLVYAVEDADLPAGASVESIEVDPALEVQAVSEPIPGPGRTIRLVFDAQVRDDGLDNEWPYASRPVAGPATHHAPPPSAVTVHAVPYFAWAERPAPRHAGLAADAA